MKTIYLRQKRSGNYEFSTKLNATHSFKTQKAFKEWYNNERPSRYGKCSIIKATYRLSQTYFCNAEEVLAYIKKNNIF